MAIYPVIMCGGAGTRLWPASTPRRPKQFVALIDGQSSFQHTVERLKGLDGVGALIVVAGTGQADVAAAQLEAASAKAVLLLEPEARDSAAAMAAAAAFILENDPDGVAVVLAADHHIPDAAAFRQAVTTAVGAARAGHIVTLGVKPGSASTAYGYIRPGEPLPGLSGITRVAAFVEKPPQADAEAHVRAGYLWNSGNFVVGAAVLLEALDTHSPETSAAARAAVAGADREPGQVSLSKAFCAAPKISIDYAVMEKTTRAAVLAVDFHWSDLGAWDAIWVESAKDAAGNAVVGDVQLIDVENCLIRADEGQTVAAIGLRDLAIVAGQGAILVCDLNRSQDVKRAVDLLKADGPRRQPSGGADDLEDLAAQLHQWLWYSALPLWWSVGADHIAGGFEEALDLDGRAVPGPRRVRVQARQVHVYATAGRHGWPGPWMSAVRHGLDFLETAHRRPDGLYGPLSPDDAAAPARLYDQAFVLLALASAHHAGHAPRAKGRAEQLLAEVDRQMAHSAGGFRESVGAGYQSNPHMHLLEAALAWIEAGEDGVWRALAEAIVELALTRLIDGGTGAVREHFEADWSGGQGVEPGHQFEWAALLERWSRLARRPELLATVRSLFAVGATGVDRPRGVVVDQLGEAFDIDQTRARLWPQTERLKAACGLFRATGEAGYRRHILLAAGALKAYLDVPTPGLWRDKLGADGVFAVEPAPASSLYHIVGAILDLGRIKPASSAV